MSIEIRADQTKVVNEIIDAFESGKNNVVLSAPTGWGKSILAWRVAKEMELRASVLSHQKVLLDQYHETFWNDEHLAFTTLKGKANYNCILEGRKYQNAGLAPCSFLENFKCRHKKDCSCPYYMAKLMGEESSFLNTNYQYIWTIRDAMEIDFSFGKDLYIYDEAHTVHSLYTDHRSPKITELDLKLYKKQLEFASENEVGELEHYAHKLLEEIKTIDFEKNQDDAYLFEKFTKIIDLKKENAREVHSYLTKNHQDLCETGKVTFVGALDKIESKIIQSLDIILGSRPDYDDCVFELNKTSKDSFTFTMIPFDIGKKFAMESDLFSEKRLFMSATLIDPKRFLNRLGFSENNAHIIELDSKFPVERRPIYIAPKSDIKLNYDTIKNHKEKITPFLELTKNLVLQYASEGHSGVIFTSSYELTEIVSSYLKMNIEDEVELLYNMDTSEREQVLADFKQKTNKPKCLISCSFFEGINLADDLSRYNIIFKLPYKSLGSKYVSRVKDLDPILYATWCLNDIVQASGRSMRHKDDWSDTYILDPAFRGMLFYNKSLFPKWYKKAIKYL